MNVPRADMLPLPEHMRHWWAHLPSSAGSFTTSTHDVYCRGMDNYSHRYLVDVWPHLPENLQRALISASLLLDVKIDDHENYFGIWIRSWGDGEIWVSLRASGLEGFTNGWWDKLPEAKE